MQCDLTFYNPSFFGEKDFYEKISDNSWYYEENKWEFDRALELIPENHPGSLLEIGCGNGSFRDKVSHAVASVEGIEINAKAIAACKAKGLNVSAMGLDQLRSHYDMIVSCEVFEHLDGIDFFIKHSLDRLTARGCLLIAVPNPNGTSRKWILFSWTCPHKCIEIYNPTCNSVTLTGVYTLRIYSNGSTTPTKIHLTGSILPNDVFVVCNTSAAAAFLQQQIKQVEV